MHIEFLVEEPSIEAALKNLLPKMLDPKTSFAIRVFQGKPDLLKKLPVRLRGYKKWIPENYRIVILIDRDKDDCLRLKRKIDEMVLESQLVTKSSVSQGESFQVLNRIVIEELESWFLGDPTAVKAAYPEISNNFVRKQRYSNPDTISDPWKKLETILRRYHYYPEGMPKIEVADKISYHMFPERNLSYSFQVFHSGLVSIHTH
jgi:DNA-directed RNA polymerase subunit H (RpoH/RPB5)